jgi:hypothetical protein
MSKDTTRSSLASRARNEAAIAPAAGPDSIRRIGYSLASRTDVMPPPDSMM